MNRFDDALLISLFIDSLISTPEWKALQDKTQVFNDRVSETVKSRGSHCADVGDIAEKLSEMLGADAVTSSKARLVGLIHDLGHIPYGHAGESVADTILRDCEFTPQELETIRKIRESLFGKEYTEKNIKSLVCFEHNENSVLQFITMCKRFGFEVDEEIIIGILAHSTSRYTDLPKTLVQQAVRLADKLAYINYDVDDLMTSFAKSEEELNALKELYNKPLLDPDGKEIKINLPNGKSFNVYEFLQLSSAERIDLFIEEAVKDARAQGANKPKEYESYTTILTGCNDIVVKVAGLNKAAKKATTEEEKEKALAEIDKLERELYRRSPILYAAYKVKERSDDFIRSGVGLTAVSKEDRAMNALSAVGNRDLKNEYIYKSLVTIMQKELKDNQGLSIDQIEAKYKAAGASPEFIEFYREYLQFKKEQEEIIANLPNNTEHLTYPEIYTIVNFIGIHSNTQLNELAHLMELDEKFDKEVLPQVQALLDNPELYDKEKHALTKAGFAAREKLVSEYGSKVTLQLGLEEEDQYALAETEVVERAVEAGYDVPDFVPKQKTKAVDKTEERGTTPAIFEKVQLEKPEEFEKAQAAVNEALNNGSMTYAQAVETVKKIAEMKMQAEQQSVGQKR